MSDELALIEETVEQILEQAFTDGADVVTLWTQLEELELTRPGIQESLGGSGGGWEEAAAIVRLTGHSAAPAPVGDSALVAGWMLEQAEMQVPAGILAPVVHGDLELRRDGEQWVIDGTASGVPYGRHAAFFVAAVGGRIVCVPSGHADPVVPDENLAGEPRDVVTFSHAVIDDAGVSAADQAPVGASLRERGAFVRSLELAGALERVLVLTMQHVRDRVQFGRNIGKFQAIQQELATLAGDVIAARGAVDLMLEAPSAFTIGCAKTRTSDACGRVAQIAHQLHGAIGYTEEHRLHYFTRRLWAWRDEYGSEREWAQAVGELVMAATPDGVWEVLAGTNDGRSVA